MKRTYKASAAHDLWLGKPAPRYTSYPPAPVFHEGITAHDYTTAVSAISADEPVSLYLHIPFCRGLCLYCGCHTSVTHRNERVTHYLAAVQREIKLLSGLTSKQRRISHLHLGGGTPNILTDRHLKELFAALNRAFDLGECREIAVELDPRHLTPGQIKTLAACGVTRVSLGVQDFQPEVQTAINREQPYAMVEAACRDLREAGINRINFDLIYGLPLQSVLSLEETAKLVCGLAPDRITLFSYAHVPQIKKHQKALEVYGLPDKFMLLAMESAARDVFSAAGYQAAGMDHFAKPDDALAVAVREKTLRRNFQGYTDDAARALLGIGASSISRLSDGIFQNERDEMPYREIIQKNSLATVRGVHLDREDLLRGALIEELMCYLACDVEEICRRHNYPAVGLASELEALKPYEDSGVIKREGTRLALTTPHRLAIRVIAQIFDRYSSIRPVAASRAA
ncbi:MAG: oxygen-independent coproporphyrinogen III oxidase [Alphaproteobacteria bacterium]|nr:oxygen-independent coproporphyrinogen III oxidase [Alphaproteobacteria bacterium]